MVWRITKQTGEQKQSINKKKYYKEEIKDEDIVDAVTFICIE